MASARRSFTANQNPETFVSRPGDGSEKAPSFSRPPIPPPPRCPRPRVRTCNRLKTSARESLRATTPRRAPSLEARAPSCPARAATFLDIDRPLPQPFRLRSRPTVPDRGERSLSPCPSSRTNPVCSHPQPQASLSRPQLEPRRGRCICEAPKIGTRCRDTLGVKPEPHVSVEFRHDPHRNSPPPFRKRSELVHP